MTAHILLALSRPVKRLLRPLRLRLVAIAVAASEHEVKRLREIREDAAQLEHYEHRRQVALAFRRNKLERG